MSASLDEVIAEYLQATDAGRAPDRAAWIRRHEAHAEALREFFENEDLVTDPLSQPLPIPTLSPDARVGADRGSGPLAEDSAEGYTIVRRLGAGGMGVVYEAEQAYPHRRVALKVIRGGRYVDERHIRLFRREVETLARLEHPSIAAIHEASLTADGHHFFAMEYVDGCRLDTFVRDHALSLEPKLRLFQRICAAVHYAHEHEVIHRDLKPSNIFVTGNSEDDSAAGTPGVKILDFGLARITDAKIGEASLVTEVGRIQGTLQYMSPEQARGDTNAIDRRTDVYSLGVILYELVAGRRPYDVGAFQRHELFRAIRVICEQQPLPPGSVEGSGHRRVARGTLSLPAGSRDLDTIVLKALEKEPERRYGTVSDLADDIERYLTNQPIHARPPSVVYRSRKFIARHRMSLAFVALVTLLLAALAVSNSIQSARVARQREAAKLARAEEATLRAEVESRERSMRRSAYASRISRAEQAWDQANLTNMLRLLDAARPGPGEADLRSFAWYHLWRLCHGDAATLSEHDGPVLTVAFSPDGKWLASGGVDSRIVVWSRETHRLRFRFGGHSGPVRAVAFSPDGSRLASASADGTIKLWDLGTGMELATLRGHTAVVDSVAFSDDGALLASGSRDRTAILWDLADLRPRATLTEHAHEVRTVAFAPGGGTLATGGWDAKVRLWDTRTGTRIRILEGHTDGIYSVRFSPDGKHLASASYDRSVRLWDLVTGQAFTIQPERATVVRAVAFSPDGATLAAAGDDTTIRLYEVSSGSVITTLKGHLGRIHDLAWSPDGARLASASSDGTVKLWDRRGTDEPATLRTYRGPVNAVAFAPDGKTLIAAIHNYDVQVWDVHRGEFRFALQERHSGWVYDVAYSPGGTRFASASADGTVKLWSARAPQEAVTEEATLEGHADAVRAVAFAPDGATLATASADTFVRLWNFQGMDVAATLTGHTASVLDVAYAPGGRWLASTSADRTAILWDLETNRAVARLSGHDGDVMCAAFSPDGTVLATAGADRTVRIWGIPEGTLRTTLTGHASGVYCATFSPDGKILATGSADRTVKLWDAVTGYERITLSGHKHTVRAVAFSPDGRTLVTGSEDETIRLWHTAPVDDGE